MKKDEDITVEDLMRAGEVEKASNRLWEEFNRARELETHAINEFDKALWLTNSGAATVTLGYITSTQNPTMMQFLGAATFVLGILSLLLMKFIGETNAVRDRLRRQTISEAFFLNGAPMSSFDKIRDSTFRRLSWAYKSLKSGAGICFIVGCIVTLIGMYPLVVEEKAYNKQLQPTAKSAAE